MHFSHNPTCEKASFLANFATRDPGTQTVWASLMAVPTEILHAATGIPEAKINDLKQYKLVIAPGTGGEECLKKCGRSFDLVSLPGSRSIFKQLSCRSAVMPGVCALLLSGLGQCR